jgi:hypothetical protein
MTDDFDVVLIRDGGGWCAWHVSVWDRYRYGRGQIWWLGGSAQARFRNRPGQGGHRRCRRRRDE